MIIAIPPTTYGQQQPEVIDGRRYVRRNPDFIPTLLVNDPQRIQGYVDIQLIGVSDDRFSDNPVYGHPIADKDIREMVERIFIQAGIAVNWLPPKKWNHSPIEHRDIDPFENSIEFFQLADRHGERHPRDTVLHWYVIDHWDDHPERWGAARHAISPPESPIKGIVYHVDIENHLNRHPGATDMRRERMIIARALAQGLCFVMGLEPYKKPEDPDNESWRDNLEQNLMGVRPASYMLASYMLVNGRPPRPHEMERTENGVPKIFANPEIFAKIEEEQAGKLRESELVRPAQ